MEHPPSSHFARFVQRMKAKSSSFEAACSIGASLLRRPQRMRARWRSSRRLRRGCWVGLGLMVIMGVLGGMLFWYFDWHFLGGQFTGKWRKQRIPVVGEEFCMKVGYVGAEELCQLSPAGALATRHWMWTAWTDGPYVEVPGFDRPTEATLWYNATSANGEHSCTGRYQVTVTAVILHNDPFGMLHSEKHAVVENIRLLERLTRPAERTGTITVLPGECHVHVIDADREHQVERYLVDVPAGRRLYVTAEPDWTVDKNGRSGERLLSWRVVRPEVKRAQEQKKGSPTSITYLVTTEEGIHEIEVERDAYPKKNPWSKRCEPRHAYGFRVTWGPSPWDDCPSIEASCELLGLTNEAMDPAADGCAKPGPPASATTSTQSSSTATATDAAPRLPPPN